jgi:hypothetical protein
MLIKKSDIEKADVVNFNKIKLTMKQSLLAKILKKPNVYEFEKKPLGFGPSNYSWFYNSNKLDRDDSALLNGILKRYSQTV